MLRPLLPHPTSAPGPVAQIEAQAQRRRQGWIEFAYVIHGDIGAIVLPPGRPPTRRDNLWKRTCFEAFAQDPGSTAYCEWNLSPSSQWAAYAFDRYREGMRNQLGALTPRFTLEAKSNRYELRAVIDVSRAPLPADAVWRVGLTAVIETAQGLSYWALAHPSPQPDFHNAAGFVYDAPPAETS